MPRTDRIRCESIRIETGMKNDVLQKTEEQQLCKWRTAELLDRLQNGTHRGCVGVADQSTHGRMGLGAACKAETSRLKNISIENFAGINYIFGLTKTV
jgi:hypothetical protein